MTTTTQDLTTLTTLITSCTGLDYLQSQTFLNYLGATYGTEELNTFPPLLIFGDFSTGKTTLLSIASEAAKNTLLSSGMDTKAQQRDDMGDRKNACLLIDEADNLDEDLLINRYSRDSEKRRVKRSSPGGGWPVQELSLFGPSILHRRRPLKDPAVLSRCISLRTQPKPLSSVQSYLSGSASQYRRLIERTATYANWGELNLLNTPGRPRRNWAPLIEFQRCLDSTSPWLDHAEQCILTEEGNIISGREEEPSIVVFNALITLALREVPGVNFTIFQERIKLLDLEQRVKEEGMELNRFQLKHILEDLTFHCTNHRGWAVVNTGSEVNMRVVAESLGLDISW